MKYKIRKVIYSLLTLAFILASQQSVVLAQLSDETKRSILKDYVWYKPETELCSFNVSTSTSVGEKLNLEAIAGKYNGFHSAVVKQLNGKVLAAYRAGEHPVAVASVIKLIIADVFLNTNPDLDKEITVQASELYGDGSEVNLRAGQRLSLREVLRLTLMRSSDTGANILINQSGGLDKSTESAHDLGYNNSRITSYFHNPPVIGPGGPRRSTVNDLTKALENIFAATGDDYQVAQEALRRDEFDFDLDSEANKWGGTSLVTGNAAIFEINSKKYIITLFIEGAWNPSPESQAIKDLRAATNEIVAALKGSADTSLPICACSAAPGSYSPFFPQGSGAATMAAAIQKYIKDTVPSSPLADFAQVFVDKGQQYNANPFLVVAMAQKETSLGTAGYGTPSGGYNITNLRPNGFARYSSYPEGIEASYKNLAGDLYLGPPSNFTTIEQIINRWAPPSDNNDTVGYIKFVKEVMDKLSGGAIGGGCGGSGIVDASGYAFPVAPQKKSENSGVPAMSPLPCGSPTSCHHPFTAPGSYAFDISRKPGGDATVGTAVYAISDGRVDSTNIYQGIAGCNQIHFKSSKDNFWYYYTHLGNVLVQPGDIVKAGDQLAEIGERKCAQDTDPHLHIDRGCVENGVPLKGGREDCRDPGIVPLINSLFENLPD